MCPDDEESLECTSVIRVRPPPPATEAVRPRGHAHLRWRKVNENGGEAATTRTRNRAESYRVGVRSAQVERFRTRFFVGYVSDDSGSNRPVGLVGCNINGINPPAVSPYRPLHPEEKANVAAQRRRPVRAVRLQHDACFEDS